MPIDAAKVDLILQYALLLAGQEDEYFERQLGPIHLIKYCYLADLIHARSEQGQTFTGATWTFYNFGPWAQDVYARIPPALKMLGADEKVMQSDYEERQDWVRWCKSDEEQLSRLERQVPSSIRIELRGLVHRLGKDTPALLDHVYKTSPMLGAEPGGALDFTLEIGARPSPKRSGQAADAPSLSMNKQKKLRERMRVLREQSAAAKAEKPRLVKLAPPRYDEIFEQGVAWLDGLAGPRPPEGSMVAEFSDDVWKSTTRKGSDLS